MGVGCTRSGASPERNEEDAVDDVELLQDTGHAGGCELRGGREMSRERRRGAGVGAGAREGAYLEGRDVGAGAAAVDLVHGALQGHGLLGQALEVLRALLGLLVVLAQLRGRRHRQEGVSGAAACGPAPPLQPRAAHLGLVDGVTLLLVLQGRPELGFALVDPGDKVVAARCAGHRRDRRGLGMTGVRRPP